MKDLFDPQSFPRKFTWKSATEEKFKIFSKELHVNANAAHWLRPILVMTPVVPVEK